MEPRHSVRKRIAYFGVTGLLGGLVWWGWPQLASPSTSTAAGVIEVTPPAPSTQEQPPGSSVTPHNPVAKVSTYVVQAGDTIESIAASFGLKPETILSNNDITNERLVQIGKELAIPAADGILHVVTEGDTFWDVASLYSVESDTIIRANPDLSPDTLQPGQRLLVPGATPPRRTSQVVSRAGSRQQTPAVAASEQSAASTTGPMQWPLSGPITDYYGWRVHPVYGTRNFHEGIDIAVPADTPVRAVAGGTVTMAEWYGGYGLTVRIDHGAGLVSRYSHNASLLVNFGDTVEPGQVIARSGNTGVSTGPHLDFGLYTSGKPVDPLSLLPR